MGQHRISRRTVLGTAAVAGVALTAASPGRAGAAPEAPVAGPAAQGVPLDNRMATDAQWADFLRGCDLVWKRLPTVWHEGPFLGDGRLGTMVYQEPGKNQLRFTVQHGEVQDHRPEFGSQYGVCRLPVGYLTLEPAGTISSVDWRLDLWNAELAGTVTTSAGTLTLRAHIHDQVLVARVTASGGEQVKWTFHPQAAISPAYPGKPKPDGYTDNPAPVTKSTGDVKQVTQTLLGGGRTSTAYRQVGDALLLSVAHSYPGTTAEATALNRVTAATADPAAHRAWWHAFHRRSFVSIPDQRIQAFHWIQLYKVASASRAGGPVMATTGPWLEPTPWPAVWWNLNVQLEYWLIHGSNHLELDAVTSTLANNQQQLIDNVSSAYRSDSSGLGRSSDMFCNRSVGKPGDTGTPEVGDLTWALHNVWLSYRHSMDDTMLRTVLFPILRRAVNYYLRFLTTDSAGRMHLPQTFSPEYGTNAPDCNYDLALLHWGCQTLRESAARLGITDPLAARWQQVLDKLAAAPTDANGFMIGAGVPFAMSHRHYSHLLSVYPLYLVNWDQPGNRALIETSVNHWLGLTGAHRGYSYTGAASFCAMMGRGNAALTWLTKFFDPTVSYPVRANTMYTEAGPVIETPLSASQSLHDMLVSSWGGVIRVFPAVPDAWADVTVHDFRTQGAFLVSAARVGGATRFVRVRSLAGEPLRLRPGLSSGATVLQAEDAVLAGGVVEANHAGYTGTGFVNFDNVVGSAAQFTVTAPSGPTNLLFRYANGTAVDRPCTLTVNGTAVTTLSFPGTGNWDTWATRTATVTLTAGSNTVRLAATTANGGPNLDSLAVGTGGGLAVVLDDGSAATWRDLGDGLIEIDLARDREVLVHAAGPTPACVVAPVAVSRPGAAWGLPA
ncbi:carbohydrate-binding protein [Longispora sp. K20-0274]|uniref:glycosyl hydrolase family 95 catalytic domain-containing protein n=1 Tax=Longispora sp. K20-0274 TaxID=3088255 RepID=UPI003999C4A4